MPHTSLEKIPKRPHRVDEVVRITGFSRATIYRWVDQGKLDSIQPGRGYGMRITYESLVRLWQGRDMYSHAQPGNE